MNLIEMKSTSRTGMLSDTSSSATCYMIPVLSVSVLDRLCSISLLMRQPVTASAQAAIASISAELCCNAKQARINCRATRLLCFFSYICYFLVSRLQFSSSTGSYKKNYMRQGTSNFMLYMIYYLALFLLNVT